jgi:NAD(P)-dependent dehydrogenase (short-subunit alcohol dehydrogenase family)
MRFLVTGAGSGIGREVARLAVRQADPGAVSLALVGRGQEALDAVAAELTAAGATCLTVVADLADPESPGKAVAAAVDAFGGLDAVVSGAGAIAAGPLTDFDLDTWDRLFAVNTRATWLLGRAAHPALRESRGSLVAVASMSASHPTPPTGAYGPSKAALVMLVRQLALEWGRDGIRANCVSPGPTDTDLTRNSFGADGPPGARRNREHRTAVIPLGKIGTAEEVATAVLFLAGPAASHITGVDLPVDGGLGLTLMPVAGGVPGYYPQPNVEPR